MAYIYDIRFRFLYHDVFVFREPWGTEYSRIEITICFGICMLILDIAVIILCLYFIYFLPCLYGYFSTIRSTYLMP